MTRRHPVRREQYEAEHVASSGRRPKPDSLRGLLRWAQREYALEHPPRLHDRDIADDGAPDHTPEAKRWVGLTQDREPNDWKAVARRLDEDGYFRTPLRAALEAVPGDERRSLLRAVLPNVFFPTEAAEAAGIPRWCAEDVLFRALSLLWDRFEPYPMPQPSRKSDAQLDAEAAA